MTSQRKFAVAKISRDYCADITPERRAELEREWLEAAKDNRFRFSRDPEIIARAAREWDEPSQAQRELAEANRKIGEWLRRNDR